MPRANSYPAIKIQSDVWGSIQAKGDPGGTIHTEENSELREHPYRETPSLSRDHHHEGLRRPILTEGYFLSRSIHGEEKPRFWEHQYWVPLQFPLPRTHTSQGSIGVPSMATAIPAQDESIPRTHSFSGKINREEHGDTFMPRTPPWPEPIHPKGPGGVLIFRNHTSRAQGGHQSPELVHGECP